MDIETLKMVVCEVITTHTDELSCSECFELLDKYAELTLIGQDAARRMPHVHDHLERCTDCREEWSGLLAALEAFSRDLSGPTTTGHPH
jgi:hypothetical protein